MVCCWERVWPEIEPMPKATAAIRKVFEIFFIKTRFLDRPKRGLSLVRIKPLSFAKLKPALIFEHLQTTHRIEIERSSFKVSISRHKFTLICGVFRIIL